MLLEIMYFIVSFMNKIFLKLFFFFFLGPSQLIYISVWVLIEVAFCITFCCSGSCSNYITLKTNCWLCLLQHRKPADDMLIGCSSRSPVGDGPASPKYSDRLSLAVNNYLSEASRQEVKSKLILLLKFWKSMFRCFFFFFFFFLGNLLLQGI